MKMFCDPQYADEDSKNACDDEHAYDSDDYEEYYSDDEKADVAVACGAVACGVSVDPSEQEDGDENADSDEEAAKNYGDEIANIICGVAVTNAELSSDYYCPFCDEDHEGLCSDEEAGEGHCEEVSPQEKHAACGDSCE